MEHGSIYRECLKYFNECSTLFYRATKIKLKDRDDELFVVMASCLNTARGTLNLASAYETENEAVMLMRALLERLVNYNYLRKASEEEYKKYWLYPYYRMYHDTHRSIDGLSGRIQVKLNQEAISEFKEHPKVKNALTKFSSTYGGMSWTKKSFNERLKEVTKNPTLSESMLMINSLLTYRSASESLHGSIYGIMQLTGLFEINNNFTLGDIDKEQVRLNVERNLGFRLVLLGHFMVDTAHALSIDYDDKSLKDASSKLKESMVEILKKIEKMEIIA